jgi:membrane protein implicated in regulation of membrane protease activity
VVKLRAQTAEAGDVDSALSLLALGKLPLALRLMLLAFSFGGVGLVLGPVIRAITPGPPLMGDVLAVFVAAVGSVVLSGGTARLLVRRVPLLETETVRHSELVGATGYVVLSASPLGGVVHVHDRRGNLHQVSCRLGAGEARLPAGTEVLLVDYDERRNTFLAAKNPIAGG